MAIVIECKWNSAQQKRESVLIGPIYREREGGGLWILPSVSHDSIAPSGFRPLQKVPPVGVWAMSPSKQ
jgi:hypothetical protein